MTSRITLRRLTAGSAALLQRLRCGWVSLLHRLIPHRYQLPMAITLILVSLNSFYPLTLAC